MFYGKLKLGRAHFQRALREPEPGPHSAPERCEDIRAQGKDEVENLEEAGDARPQCPDARADGDG